MKNDIDLNAIDISAADIADNNENKTVLLQQDKYFKSKSWGSASDLLHHLCQYSNHAVLVTGEDGLGKTTLVQSFLEEHPEGFRFCSLVAQDEWNANILLQQIILGFNLAWQEELTLTTEDLHAAVLADDQIWVLFIDEAQLLTPDLLEWLVNFAKQNIALGNNANKVADSIHLVLLGNELLEEKLLVLKLQQLIIQSFNTIQLQPLGAQEVGAYLQHKWNMVGNQIPLPFDRQTIKRIIKLSQGNLKLIENLANDVLAGKKLASNKLNLGLFKVNYPIITGVIALAGLLGWLFVTANSMPNASIALIPHQELALSKIPEKTATVLEPIKEIQQKIAEIAVTAESLTPKVEININQQSSSNHDPVITKTQKLAELRAAVASARKHEHDSTVNAAKLNETMSAAIAEKKQQENSDTQSIVTDPKVVNKDPKINHKNQAEKALLTLSKQSYTLQLIAASKPEGIRRIIKEYNLTGKTYYYQTLRKGKEWHVLVYGNYEDYAAAKKFVENLPADLQKLLQLQQTKAWIRSVAEVQQEITRKN